MTNYKTGAQRYNDKIDKIWKEAKKNNDKEELKRKIIYRLETLKNWRYEHGAINNCWAGVDEDEEKKIIDFINSL